jgi:hypothetical protein
MSSQLFPICRKCGLEMRLARLEDVTGPSEQLCVVSVFRCEKCDRLTANELAMVDLARERNACPDLVRAGTKTRVTYQSPKIAIDVARDRKSAVLVAEINERVEIALQTTRPELEALWDYLGHALFDIETSGSPE